MLLSQCHDLAKLFLCALLHGYGLYVPSMMRESMDGAQRRGNDHHQCVLVLLATSALLWLV
uniref:Uncharacterized protein n=1 Tax=Oryza brachyantha TaxID=4533 RepID=J3LC76_ORYBR